MFVLYDQQVQVRFQVDLGRSNVHNHREESALCDLYLSLNIKLSFGTVDPPLPLSPPLCILPQRNIKTKQIRTGTIV